MAWKTALRVRLDGGRNGDPIVPNSLMRGHGGHGVLSSSTPMDHPFDLETD